MENTEATENAAAEVGAWNPDTLHDAELQCMDRIAEALGLRVGVNAFIGLHPGLSDCVVWDIGFLYTGDQASFPANTFHWRGKLELYSRTRQQIQRWIMALLRSFPIAPVHGRATMETGEGPVRILRIAPENGGVGEIATQTVKQHDKDPGRETFYCPANFDVVFTIKE
jgi:hypothetical protein